MAKTQLRTVAAIGAERIDLGGALDGYHILVDPDALTLGLAEDLASENLKVILDALAAAIVGGDLPKGSDRAGLRRLKVEEFKALVSGLNEGYSLPKSSG